MVDTVPTAAEDSGDFSQSGVNIYDPNTTTANPGYNPSLPASPSNPQYIRQQFSYNGVLNVIPPNRLTQAASIMLNQYTPQPNTMDMGSMTMMGQPTVIGAGNDANNYLDTRKEHMTDDQGTLRVDHSFANGDTAFIPLLCWKRIRLHARGPAWLRFVSRQLLTAGRPGAGPASCPRTWLTWRLLPSHAWSWCTPPKARAKTTS